MAVWSERDETSDTLPPVSDAGPRQRFGRLLLRRDGAVERALVASRALFGQDDSETDWQRAQTIYPSLVRGERGKTADALTRLHCELERMRDEARRLGIEQDLLGCLQERNVMLDSQRVADGIGCHKLYETACEYEAMAGALRDLGEEMTL
jgi:hypothetical protein